MMYDLETGAITLHREEALAIYKFLETQFISYEDSTLPDIVKQMKRYLDMGITNQESPEAPV